MLFKMMRIKFNSKYDKANDIIQYNVHLFIGIGSNISQSPLLN